MSCLARFWRLEEKLFEGKPAKWNGLKRDNSESLRKERHEGKADKVYPEECDQITPFLWTILQDAAIRVCQAEDRVRISRTLISLSSRIVPHQPNLHIKGKSVAKNHSEIQAGILQGHIIFTRKRRTILKFCKDKSEDLWGYRVKLMFYLSFIYYFLLRTSLNVQLLREDREFQSLYILFHVSVVCLITKAFGRQDLSNGESLMIVLYIFLIFILTNIFSN